MSDLQGIRMILFGILLAIVGFGMMVGGGFIAYLGVGMMYFGLLFGVMGQFGVGKRAPGKSE